MWWAQKYDAESVKLMQRVMEIDTQSMDRQIDRNRQAIPPEPAGGVANAAL
jgi:hypothetical protein